MQKILNKLRGKSVFDILVRLLKEIFILFSKLFTYNKSHKEFFIENSLLNNKRLIISNSPKVFKYPFFDFCDNNKVVDWANEIVKHEFDLLGSGKTEVSYDSFNFSFEGFSYNFQPNKAVFFCKEYLYKPIDWHCDFKSGYRWDNSIIYSNVRKQSNGLKGVDIKVPWELSRFQHLSVLIKAFEITNNKLYLEEVLFQMTDWILNNSQSRGVNWTCTMDVAMRLANWSIALDYIEKIYEIPEDIKRIFLKSFKGHVKYIMFNLEWTNKLTSNHYLSDISGLYVSLLYSGKYKFLKTWAKNQLEKELFKQTYKDGMNSESSTSYHRLVLELFAFPVLFSKTDFSEKYLKRLEKMFEFIFWLKKENGSIPIFGDNDSGLFIYCSIDQKSNLLYFNTLYQKIFKKNIDQEKYKGAHLFEDSGLFIYKKDIIHLAVANMPNGQKGNGGHCHNDKLSFELTLGNSTVLIDPGTYVYTPLPSERNKYRATNSHNTVCIENSEQNRFIENNLFRFKQDVDEVINKVEFNSEGVFQYTGSHNGYYREGKDFLHQRKFQVSTNSIQISDKIISKESSNCFAIFIMPKKHFKNIEKNTVMADLINIEFNSNKIRLTETIQFANAYGELGEPLIKIKVDFMNQLESKIVFK